MARPRMYLKGAPCWGIFEVLSAISDGKYLIFADKPMHPAVIKQWRLAQIIWACRANLLFFAIPNPEHPSNKKEIAA